ncbi:MAG: radical SAM protein [Thermodesulfobacteriota bacterium]
MGEKSPDILLISPQVDLDTIGLKSLQALLRQAGFKTVILYLPGLRPDDDALMEKTADLIRQTAPGFVGISLMSHEYYSAAALSARIRKAAPGIPVVWGGVHPTIAPEMCLESADFVCVGEGEKAMVAFAAAVFAGENTDAIPGLWRKEGGNVIRTGPAPLTEDIDRLPFANFLPGDDLIAHNGRLLPLDQLLFRKYARWQGIVYSIMGSRGCPFACSYCCNDFVSRLYGTKAIRRRSVNNIIAELESALAVRPDIAYINFQDDCFLACSDEYLEQFCGTYRNRVRRPFIVRCIPSFVTESRLRRLKHAGLSWISMGLQSGSDRVLTDIYQRRSLVEDFLRAATLIHKADVAAYYDVILDNPLETDDDRLETIRALTAISRPYFVQLFSLALYPGTGLYRKMAEENSAGREDYLVKNYHDYAKTDLNRLIRMSGYLPPGLIRHLTDLYKKNRFSPRFRFLLGSAGMASALLLEPVASFRLIRKSCGGDAARAARLLPAYLRVGLSRYVKQFRGKAVKRIECMIRDHSSAGG